MGAEQRPVSGYVTNDGRAVGKYVGVRHLKGGRRKSGGFPEGKPGDISALQDIASVEPKNSVFDEMTDEEKLASGIVMFQVFTDEMVWRENEDVLFALEGIRDSLIELFGEREDFSHGREVDDIIFALDPETSRWAQEGVGVGEGWQNWEAVGFTPEEAGGWLRAGVPLKTALLWKDFSHKGSEDYLVWANAVNTSEFTRKDIMDAAIWNEENFAPEHYILCRDENVSLREACALRELGSMEKILGLWKRFGLDFHDIQDWVEMKLPIEEIEGWLRKGYSSGGAKAAIEKGVSVSDARDHWGGNPVPGRTWRQIGRTLDTNGWVVEGVVRGKGAGHKDVMVVTVVKDEERLEIFMSLRGALLYVKEGKGMGKGTYKTSNVKETIRLLRGE